MATGKVKWFNPERGYGFIIPDEGGPDVFVHSSEVQHAGYTKLTEGVRVAFDLSSGRNGKTSAQNLRIVAGQHGQR